MRTMCREGYLRDTERRFLMAEKFKNIAVLTTALDTDGQAQVMEGIEEYGKKHGCNIAVFAWFTGTYEKDKHNLGEINIVNLPDLDLFDGVIVMANTFHIEKNRAILMDLLSELECPVVCVGAKLADYYYVGTDTYRSMRRIVEHFVKEHKCKKIHFVKGVAGNPDGDARYQAYLDVLSENKIPIEEGRITQGDFYIRGGEQAAREIISSKLPFPEAVVCANDIMALTLCGMLKQKGYRIPEDIMISGYDYTAEGQQNEPALTTVRCRFEKMGYTACKMILDVLEGKKVSKQILLEDEMVPGRSCGCREPGMAQSGIELRGVQRKDVFQRKLVYRLIEVEKNIMEGDIYEDWLEALRKFILNIEPTEFYCCVNDDFMEKVFAEGLVKQEAMSLRERLSYSKKIDVMVAYRDGAFFKKASFRSKYAFDEMFKKSKKPKMYIFSPIHYLERNFGYFVFVDSAFPLCNPLYVNWLINMGDAIENIRKQNLLQMAVRELDEMYVRDSLTGAYNRFGMERYFKELKQECLRKKKKLLVAFSDLDGLKGINDKFGHETGDVIIKAAAEILQAEEKEFFVIRYGGDEYVVLGATENDAEAVAYFERVKNSIQRYNKANDEEKKAGVLSLSIGYQVFEVSGGLELSECIHLVDQKMYADKKSKKRKK